LVALAQVHLGPQVGAGPPAAPALCCRQVAPQGGAAQLAQVVPSPVPWTLALQARVSSLALQVAAVVQSFQSWP